jgi:hypothetical protein
MVAATAAPAQKVKYKDLFPLLAAKDYEKSEKYLRLFITQNPEHANANLNMAYFHNYKMAESDMLKDTDTYLTYGDSALTYYTKAYAYIDEKEVKKNDDFYQDFYRRDLRTGKYGVKLGDVQLDTETRMEELKLLLENVGTIANHFNSFIHGYDTASHLYSSFTLKYESFPLFLFNSTQTDVQKMNEIGAFYAQAVIDFESYKKAISVLETTPSYDQTLEIMDIEEIAQPVSPDYYATKVVLYNFGAWSENYGALISETMIPLSERMIGYNADLDELMKEAKNGKNTMEALNNFKQGAAFEVLKEYDMSPMPLSLFDFKEKGIEYYSKESEKAIAKAYDSLNYAYRKMLYDDAIERLEVVGEAYGTLQDQDFDEAEKLYGKFITAAYENKDGLVLSVAEMATSLEAETARILTQMDSIKWATEFAVASNYAVPMSIPDSIDYSIQVEDTVYYSLDIDSLASAYWVSGFEVTKSQVMTYTAEVSLMMEVDTLFTYELLKSELSVEALRTKRMPADSVHAFYVFYAQNAEEKSCIAQLIDMENRGIAWSSNLTATLPLQYIEVDEEGNLVVFFGDVVDGEEKSQIIKLNAKGEPI